MGFLRDEQGRQQQRLRELRIAAAVGRSVARAYDAETARISAERFAVSARLHAVVRTVTRALARARARMHDVNVNPSASAGQGRPLNVWEDTRFPTPDSRLPIPDL